MRNGKVYLVGATKGGVGKSVSSYNLAYSLTKLGKKVLAVDFDSQANMSTCFGVEDTTAVPITIGHLMLNQIEDEEMPAPEEYIRSRNGVDFIPSSMVLSVVDAKLRLEMGAEKMLSNILEPLKDRYDAIIIDTCPALGALTINALAAADGVIITVNPQLLAMMGLQDYVKIENDGDCIDLSHDITNYVKRGDIKFIKRSGQDSKTMPFIPFKITALDRNGTEIESHIVYTDENGVFDSSAAYVLHTYETNKGDEWYAAYLAEYEKTGQWPANAEIGIAGPVGTWFGINAPVKDSLRLNQTGALPYGTYQVEELRCEANVGMNLYTDRFTIAYEAASDKDAVVDPDGTKQGNMSGTLYFGTILNFDNNGQVPEIQTEALLQDTNSHYGSVRSDLVVIDTVAYSGLEPGKEYTLKGSLLLADTGEVLHDAMGEDAEAELTFTPDLPNGSVAMRFDLDATELDGRTAVVTEVLYDADGAIAATHTDIEDANQQIHFPGVQTQARGEYTDGSMVNNAKELTIIDTISYTGLEPGRVYRAVGYLVDRQTGDYVLDDAGGKIAGQQNFKPETSGGTLEMTFTFAAETLAGKSLVAFEEIYQGGVLVAFHKDPDDEGQTVDIPEIHTAAKYEATSSHMAFAAENMVIVDTIRYEGLEPGCTYTAVGTLYDKDEKEPALDDKGNEITAETEFVAEERDGSVDVVFHFNGKDLAGRSLVAYEKLYYADAEIAKHEDPEDEEQTVDIPKIGTTATDEATGSHYVEAGSIVITDTITYEKLMPGEEYLVSGELIDGRTGESLDITAETTFVPEESSGTVDVQFTVDASDLSGKTLVVFESLAVNGHVIAEHKDLENEGQSVHVVEIKTTAADKETGTKVVSRGKKTHIVDTVVYTGLIPGVEYTMKGTLMDKENGESIGAVAEKTFIPKDASGSIEMEFTVNTEELEGHALVVFEKLFFTDIQIAHHEDITDTEQAVYVPKLHTTATVGGKHEADASERTTLVDKVVYENLVPGVEYTVAGVLMDKKTKKPLRINGKEIKSQITFTPDKPEGTVEMMFIFDSTGMDGKELVAFEELLIGKTLMGQHKDLNDKNQTVNFRGKEP